MVMLEFEAMHIPRVKKELSAQYVDHNLLQTDFKNADDHLFLRSACMKFGVLTGCAVVTAIFIYFRHIDNIKRLLSGAEPSIWNKKD